jgi:FG-GAP repeat protein
MNPRIYFLCAAAAALSIATTLPAQLVGGQWETKWQFDGQAEWDAFGNSVSGAGDVDGDGIGDVIVGANAADPGGLMGAGSVYVYSGATGSLIWQFDGQESGAWFGNSVSGAGDIDNDGFDDVIIGSYLASPGGIPFAGSAYVYSGATGALIWQFDGQAPSDHFGIDVAAAGDVNLDGIDDLIVGAFETDPGGMTSAGSAFVYSGADGSILWQFDGQAATDFLGLAVSGAGDVNGDGFADVLIGAYAADPGGVSNAGSAFIYSGANGSLLRQFDGQAVDGRLGSAVSGAGDLNGDGFDDVILGAYTEAPGGQANAGSVYVFSGATGSLIWQFDGQAAGDSFGYSVSNAGDVDGDGLNDIIAGAYTASPGGVLAAGAAFVYSGATGALIRQFDGQAYYNLLGGSVASVGDLDGDGLADVIVGGLNASPGGLAGAGSAFVYSLDPFLRLDTAELSASGGSSVQLDMDFPTSEAGARYAVLASITGTGPVVMAGLQIPLTQDNIFNRIIGGNVPAPLQGAHGTLNANGQALATLTAGPALSSAVGRTIYFAAVSYDVGPLTGRQSSVVRYLSITP